MGCFAAMKREPCDQNAISRQATKLLTGKRREAVRLFHLPGSSLAFWGKKESRLTSETGREGGRKKQDDTLNR